MKQFFIQLNAAIFLLSVFSFHCLGADKYTLELNLEKGKTYKHHGITDMKMTMNAMGQEIDMDMKSEICTHFEVTGKNDDVYDIKATYQKIKVNMGAPMPFNVDSEAPEQASDKNAGDLIKSFTEIHFDIQLNKQGKVLSVIGAEKLEEKLNSTANEQFKQMFGQQFSEKAVQATIEQMLTYFPGNSVDLNESWDVARNINSAGFDIIVKMKFTLKEVKDDVAQIDCTATLTTPEGGAVLQIQGMDANVSMKGEQAGTFQVDMKTGWIVRSEMIQKSTQDIDIMGQAMQQKMEVKVTVTAD